MRQRRRPCPPARPFDRAGDRPLASATAPIRFPVARVPPPPCPPFARGGKGSLARALTAVERNMGPFLSSSERATSSPTLHRTERLSAGSGSTCRDRSCRYSLRLCVLSLRL